VYLVGFIIGRMLNVKILTIQDYRKTSWV